MKRNKKENKNKKTKLKIKINKIVCENKRELNKSIEN